MKLNLKELKPFYVTFGIGTVYGRHYQLVLAKDMDAASEKAFELFGKDWAFVYSKEKWEQYKEEGFFGNLQPFAPVVSLRGITVEGVDEYVTATSLG